MHGYFPNGQKNSNVWYLFYFEWKVLFLSSDIDENLFLSLRNLPNLALLKAINASTYDLIDSDFILIDKKGLESLNEGLAVK